MPKPNTTNKQLREEILKIMSDILDYAWEKGKNNDATVSLKNRDWVNKKTDEIITKVKQEGREEVRQLALDERDKVAKNINEFNKLDDDYQEVYYIAMNTIITYIENHDK